MLEIIRTRAAGDPAFARFNAGYAFAQQENGALAGMAQPPPDSPLERDPDFIRGYDSFWNELRPAARTRSPA